MSGQSRNPLRRPGRVASELARDTFWLCLRLFRVMIPVLIAVRLLQEVGGIELLARLLEPLMMLVGLPASMGLVWATTLLTNLYGGMIIFFNTPEAASLSVAQATVLCTMMLVAHALPVEGRIAQQAGVRIAATVLIRLAGALLFGAILFRFYAATGWLQQPVELLWQPPPIDHSWTGWALGQLKGFGWIVLIVFGLLALLRVLRVIGVERVLIWLLQPLLRLMGIGPQATTVTIVGITLGITYGGGLLIREARAGHVSARDLFASLTLLGLCHSIIEDTLLMLLMGADLSGVLWGRLLLSLLSMVLLMRLVGLASERFRQRFLFCPVAS